MRHHHPRPQGEYNGVYTGERAEHIAFPMGGMGAGMICLEGTGALSHVSLRHQPDMFNEPAAYSAICINPYFPNDTYHGV